MNNFHESFAKLFQIPDLRKINIANTEPIFDQDECDIQILR